MKTRVFMRTSGELSPPYLVSVGWLNYKQILTTLLLFAGLFLGGRLKAQVGPVNLQMDVIEVTHGYDCGNDATGTCCGCWISICNDPEPRWKFWGRLSGGTWLQAATFPLNGGTRGCGIWNHGDFDLLNLNNNSTSAVDVWMESWEEDGCGGDNDYNTGCANNDDAYSSLQLATINFRRDAPNTFNQYGWFYGNNGYGARVDINYQCLDAGDQNAYGSNSWRGYVYDGTGFNTYMGYITQSETFDQTFSGDGDADWYPTSCREFQKSTFSVRYKMTKNFPCGMYTFTIGGDDGHRLSLDGGATWILNRWFDQGYSTTTSGAVYLSGNTNLVLEFYEGGGGNRISFTYANVTPAFAGGSISGATTICSGVDPSSGFTQTAASGGAGTITYQWQQSPSGCGSWSNATPGSGNATSATFDPPSLSATTCYRRVATDQCGTTSTVGPFTVTISNPTPLTGGSITTSTQTICSGGDPAAIVTATAASNGTGSYTYSWQSRDNCTGGWGTIGSTNNVTYDPPSGLTVQRCYQRTVSDGCTTATATGTGQVNIDATTVAGSVTPVASGICQNSSTTINLTGNTGTVQLWYRRYNGGSYASIGNAGVTSLNTGSLTPAGTYDYYADIKNGACNTVSTAATTVTVSATTVAGTVTPVATNICQTTGSTTINLTGNTGTVQRWFRNFNGGAYSDIGNVGVTSLGTGTLSTVGTYGYYAEVKSGTCLTQTTNVTTVTVDATTVAGSIAAVATNVCQSVSSTTINLTGNTGTVQRWFRNFNGGAYSDIGNAGVTSLSTGTLGTAGSYGYYAEVKNGQCTTLTTNVVTVVVDPTSVAGSVTPSTTAVCNGSLGPLLTLGSSTGSVINRQESTDGIVVALTVSYSTTTYSVPATTATRYYRFEVKSGTCASATSSWVSVTTNQPANALSGVASTTCTMQSENGRVYFLNGTNAIIGAVTDPTGGGNLGSITGQVTYVGAPLSIGTEKAFGRLVAYTNGTSIPNTVRIYFTDADFTAWKNTNLAVFGPYNINNLRVYKTSGVVSTTAGYDWAPLTVTARQTNDPATGINWIEVSNTGFSTFAIGADFGVEPLPIAMLSQHAQCFLDGTSMNIEWITSTEVNNKNFTIERSSDGIDWMQVCDVNGAGNSNTTRYYSCQDNDPILLTRQDWYYRITQTDFDGTSKTFPIMIAVCDPSSISESDQVTVFPNPAIDQTTIQTIFANDTRIKMTVLAQNGDVVKTMTYQAGEGTTQVTLPTYGLPAGSYYIVLETPVKRITRTLVVTK